MVFKDSSSAIKPVAADFNADISPAQLLTKMFQDEARYQFDHFIQPSQVGESQHGVAKKYLEMRAKLVERVFKMGEKFEQRQRTLHTGVELMDRFFLDRKIQGVKDLQAMQPKRVHCVMITCFLIASKYDEIDDHLVFINDVQKYYVRVLREAPLLPTWADVVETERMLMNFFGWDLGFVLPIHYVEMFLANGVLFESEHNPNIKKTRQTAASISKRAYELLDEMIKPGKSFKNLGFTGNQVASMVVFTARQEVLNLSRSRYIWPKELQLISRMTDKQVKKLASIYRRNLETKHRIEPFEETHTPTDTDKGAQHFGSMVYKMLDLTKLNKHTIDPSLVSPKATSSIHFHEGSNSLVKDRGSLDDVPVAQLVISKNGKGLAQQRKLQISTHKNESQANLSGVKQTLSKIKAINMSKQSNLMRSRDTLVSKIINNASSNKKQSNFQNSLTKQHVSAFQLGNASAGGADSTRHFISAQKSDQGKVRLFTEKVNLSKPRQTINPLSLQSSGHIE
mmetsp:Transcript_3/g.4  ORF Transcript_3/g.4 Transcript_3/m.4 type:complete len:510 (-) Transcript_3:465-1994(-)